MPRTLLVVVYVTACCLLHATNARTESATAEFRVNTVTDRVQQSASVAIGPGGDFVVAWQSEIAGSGDEIRARRFDARGIARGEEQAVNGVTRGNQRSPAVAMDAKG